MLGMGFIVPPEERQRLIEADPRNAERLLPYLGGDEVNTSPTQTFDRYVISFGDLTLEESSQWPELLAMVRERVKPERDRLRDNADGRKYKQYWWRFRRSSPSMFSAIARLDRCLVTARVTKHLCFSFQPVGRAFNEKLYVFPFDSHRYFSLLQSRIHSTWTWLLSSTMKTDLNYSATDCFETFPFPSESALATLETIGRELYDARAHYMVDTNQGLTATYNQLKDPDCADDPISRIRELRRLHEELDRAVLAAYGWSDIAVPPYCPATPEEKAAVALFEDTVIDRLFALNAERAAEEAAAAGQLPPAAVKVAKAAKPKAKKLKSKSKSDNQPSLLDDE